MPSETTTSSREATLQSTFRQVAGQLREIGISLVVYDQAHAPTPVGEPACEFCQRLCGPEGPCRQARNDLVEQVWSDGQARVLTGPMGCALLVAPIMQRRRIDAMALACYPPGDLAQREQFPRACDQFHLDRQFVAAMLARCPAHGPAEAPHLLKVLQWLLSQGMENTVSTNELATLSSNLANTYEELSLLYRLSGSMKVNSSPAEFFTSVCGELLEVMQIGAVVAILKDRLNPEKPDKVVRAGTLDLDDDQLRLMVERHVVPRIGGASRSLVDNVMGSRSGRYARSVRNLLAVPLATNGSTKGLLVGINKAEGEFNSVDLKLINSVGNQAAVFLANYHLYEELQELLMGVLHLLTASIDAKDRYTCGHSQRVAMISRKLAEMCGFDDASIQRIYLAGLLHDIGKIGVPESVLCKTGKLTDEEFTTMKRHPVIGASILSNIRQMQDVIPGVLRHHERPDGRGYPDGLAGDQVPMDGLIVGLADCFDAMTSSRTYRRALPLETVTAEIIRFSGTQFHPQLVDHLLSLDLAEFLADLRQSESTGSAIGGAILAGSVGESAA